MKSNFLKFRWLFIVTIGMFLASCTDSTDTVDEAAADSFAEEVVFRTQEATNLGRFGCYELVFPVSINLPDGSTVSVDSYEAFKLAIKDWRLNNPKVRTKPVIGFPYEIITSEGEVITVDDVIEQKELRIACKKDFFDNHDPRGHNDRPKLCFRIVLPFSVSLPDGTVISITGKDDKKALHDAIKAYISTHPGEKVRPQLVFPVNVTMQDGTSVTVSSKEDLKALKDGCN